MRAVGIGYRGPLAKWIDRQPPEIECLEITAEHFFDGGLERLAKLKSQYPLFVHGLGLSLGTPGPLDRQTLEDFARVVDAADPIWISEHVAFTRSDETDLGHLNPIQPTRETLSVIAEHATELVEYCRRPLVLENITSHLQIVGDYSEPEFLGLLCEQAKCGLLLDVTNLFINSRNHGFCAVSWLRDLPADRITQLHIVGYSYLDGHWHDHHREAIQDDLKALLHEVLDYASVQAITLERDGNFPIPAELARELRELKLALTQHEPDHRTRTATD